MIDFLLLILAGVGLTFILVRSSISQSLKYHLLFREEGGEPKPRFTGRKQKVADKFVEMLECYQCAGFWSGLVVYTLYYFDAGLLLWGFAISLLAMLFDAGYSLVGNLSAAGDHLLEKFENEQTDGTGH